MKIVQKFVFGQEIPDDATFLFYDGPKDQLVYEVPLEVKNEKRKKADDKMDEIEAVINHLNAMTGSRFTSRSAATVKFIRARMNEGRTLQDFKEVINRKCGEWLDDPKWSKFLRPETLFGTKFDSYLSHRSEVERNDDVFKELENIMEGVK